MSFADLWTNKQTADGMIALVIAFITGVLSPIVASWAKAKFTTNKVKIEEEETDEILKMLHANERIDYRLESFRSEHNFDRVWIAQFHNGGAFYPSERILNKFQKLSLTYEACKNGIASELSSIQNIPVTLFTAILRKVKEEGHYGIDNIEQASDTGTSLKSFWLERGVRGFHIVAIKCLKKKLLGLLVVECVSEPCLFSEETIETLIIESKILGGYLVKEDVD
jgi:hypothetical protein